ncbi:hypothetical protein [Lichenicola sp.]|uniref:hypothetical protein n=1 Tax=Lichenicola sp. TaxID=2804529 RepID=UPI003B00EE76
MTAALSGAPPGAIVWPLLAGILLMLLADRMAVRTLVRIAVVASLVTLALAVAETLPVPGRATDGAWLGDRLATALPVLLAMPGVVASVWLSSQAASGQAPDGPGWRHPLVALQLLTAGAVVAVRADPLFLMLTGLALAAAALAMLAPARQVLGRVAILGGLLLTAWLGIAMLSVGLGQPASWTALAGGGTAIPAALRLFGQLLLMLPMLLAAGLGPISLMQPASDESGTHPATAASRALLPLLPGLPALIVTLRLRALPEPDPTLLRLDILVLSGAGLLIMLLGVALLPACRTLADRLAGVSMLHLGAATIGFGVGGTMGVAAGLLILSFLCLGLPLAWLPAAPGPAGWIRRVAILALAGLPPFGPFAALFMLLLRLSADLPLVAVLVLAVFCAGALALLSTPWTPVTGLPARPASLLPAAIVLLLLATCGIAMPAPASDWLLGIGESLAGATWPALPSPHPGATP